jgi:DNA-binding beta-propeller fold protein YncE
MKSINRNRALAIAAGCILLPLGGQLLPDKAEAQQTADWPRFQLDPFWPKPLPDRWVTGSVGGTCVDAQGHVFIVARGDLSPKEQKNATASPPIIEFDQAGQMINAWGSYQTLPGRPHGCFVDYEGNVWVAGNEDAIVQKYTHDGSKLLLQIGTKGRFDTSDGTMAGAPMNSSHTLLNLPSGIAVDPANGDVYIADGYGNRRVVVFDRDGKFLRQWGEQATQAQTDAGVPGVFLKVVHCVVIGNDSLVYVCDRLGGRIEVFDKMGNFKRNIPVKSKTAPLTGIGSACWVDFSPDRAQKYIYVADCGDEEIRVLDHATGQTLSVFGRPGHQAGEFENLHSLSVDPKGNIIAGETLGGHRVQMFRLVAP